MDRDTKIGLAVAGLFLALVGGVLYYKLAHPDDLVTSLEDRLNAPTPTAVTQPLGVTTAPGAPVSTLPVPPPQLASDGPPTPPVTSLPPVEPPPNPVASTGTIPDAPALPPPAAPGPPTGNDPTASPLTSAPTVAAAQPEPVMPPTLPATPPPPPPSGATTISFDEPDVAAAPPGAPAAAPALPPPSSPTATMPEPAAPLTLPAPTAEPPAPVPPPGPAAASTPPMPMPVPMPPEKEREPVSPTTLPSPPPPSAPSPSPPASDPPSVEPPPMVPPAAPPAIEPPPVSAPPRVPMTPPAAQSTSEPPPASRLVMPPPADLEHRRAGDPEPQAQPVTAQPTGTLPPDNAYVRDYRPAAVLGKPQIEPMPAGTASQRGMPPPTGVTPVTVRPQPDLPTQDRYIPVAPTSPDGFGYVTGTPGRSAVQSYDLQSMVVRENETFATLSVLFYGSDRYQHALAEFLRDRDPRLTRLTPGQTVDLPPAEELERRFAQMILPPPAAANRDAGLMRASAPAPDAATPEPRATPPAQPGQVVMPPMASVPQQPQGASTPARPQQAAPPPAERGYRVQVNDTLFLIAKRTLGDGNRWTEIYQLNRDLLQGGTQLRADMYLRLPADAQVDAPARPQ